MILEADIEDVDEDAGNDKTKETFELACCMCINLFDTDKALLARPTATRYLLVVLNQAKGLSVGCA
jgi:type VI protein secretion system component VasA